jgi:SAM-dependent methyltransferase
VAAGYGEDLASVHEAGFSDLAEAAARMVAELAPKGRVADLGCGGGTLLADLARRGFTPWGIDQSPAMVELALARLPGAHVEVGDILEASLPPCSAVTAIGEVLNFALADRDPEAITPFLQRARAALSPDGILLLDAATTGKAQGERRVSRSGRGWRVEAHILVEGDRLTRTIDTWRTLRGVERRSREVHRQRLLETEWLVQRLEAAGFTVEVLGGYDDHGFQDGWDGFLARPR